MTIIFTGIVCLFLGWKLGGRYRDFADLMLARRVAKLVDQREKFAKEQSDYEKWERQDTRIARVNKDIEEEVQV